MKKPCAILVLSLFFSFALLSNSDSLENNWNNKDLNPEIRLNSLHQIIRNVMYSNPDSALKLAQLEFDFALELDNKSWEAKALNTMGVASNFLGDVSASLDYYNRSIEIQTELKDSFGLANTFNNIGIILDEQGNLAKAIDYYKQSLSIRADINDEKGVADCLNNMGIVYVEMDNMDEALTYYKEALVIREKLNDEFAVASSYSNLGIVYKKQGKLEKALETYTKSLEIHLKFNDQHGAASLYYNIGNLWVEFGNLDTALEYYNISIQLKKGLGEFSTTPVTLNSKALLFIDKNDWAKAKDIALESYSISQKTGNVSDLSIASSLLSKIFEQEDNKAIAYDYYKTHVKMRDSLKNQENVKAVVHLQLQNEFEKKQLVKEQQKREFERLEATQLARRDTIQYTGIGFGILILFGLLFLLGNLRLPEWMISLGAFLPFLILFEFLLVFSDPYVDTWSNGEPLIKLGLNVLMAGAIFPLHNLLERVLKKRFFKAT